MWAIDNGGVIIDMRNFYESEIGKFENAIVPDVDTSKELLPTVKKLLSKNNSGVLNGSDDMAECNGADFNLDLYVKGGKNAAPEGSAPAGSPSGSPSPSAKLWASHPDKTCGRGIFEAAADQHILQARI